MTKSGEKVSNELVISLTDIYPGMEPVNELINIENKGDSNAVINYEIISARILGDDKDKFDTESKTYTTDQIEDKISHDYPFHIDMNISKRYLHTGGEKGEFQVSISWPLDAGNDELDSEWGNKAYQFQQLQNSNKKINSNYKKKSSIEVVIRLSAEQFTGTDISNSYNIGDEVFYDVKHNTKCYQLGESCIKTTYIDNKISDDKEEVQLLPDISTFNTTSNYSNYTKTYNTIIKDWTVKTKEMSTSELVNIISNDINNSHIEGENISNIIIGSTKIDSRVPKIIDSVNKLNGKFVFDSSKFPYLKSDSCIWSKSNGNTYSINKIDEISSQISKIDPITECSVVPIIVVSKDKLLSILPE